MKSNKLLKWFKFLVIGLIFFFISRYLYTNFNLLNLNDIHIDLYLFSMSVVIYLFQLFLMVVIWFILTKQNQCSVSFFETFKIRVYSDFGKYIPGKVFTYGMLLYNYEQKGISKKKIMVCSLQESIIGILAPGIITLGCMYFSQVVANVLKTSVSLVRDVARGKSWESVGIR